MIEWLEGHTPVEKLMKIRDKTMPIDPGIIRNRISYASKIGPVPLSGYVRIQ